LVVVGYTMFHAKYLTSSLCPFRVENFKIKLVYITCGGRVHGWLVLSSKTEILIKHSLSINVITGQWRSTKISSHKNIIYWVHILINFNMCLSINFQKNLLSQFFKWRCTSLNIQIPGRANPSGENANMFAGCQAKTRKNDNVGNL
jgi:hypothetical protein